MKLPPNLTVSRSRPARAGTVRAPKVGVAVSPSRFPRAFTLIELLVVIVVIAILSYAAMPILRNTKRSDAMAAAQRQLVDDVAYARTLAIRTRSLVYMVFVPTNIANLTFNPRQEKAMQINLLACQYGGYNFLSMRKVGDQPGHNYPTYYTEWKTLPKGIFIPQWKFDSSSVTTVGNITNYGFDYLRLPWPYATSAPPNQVQFYTPVIAFNYLGQCVQPNNPDLLEDATIPLTRGTVLLADDPVTHQYKLQSPQVMEDKVINAVTKQAQPYSLNTNSAVHIVIGGLTGRATVVKQEAF